MTATVARTTQAPVALDFPGGRWARDPFLRYAMTCSMTAWSR